VREADIASALLHPSIVSVYRRGQTDSRRRAGLVGWRQLMVIGRGFLGQRSVPNGLPDSGDRHVSDRVHRNRLGLPQTSGRPPTIRQQRSPARETMPVWENS